PERIHEWMPRLAAEGVVGADAIFACLGPALEIFSRYGRVEKVSGEVVTLREYLEHVWAAVSREALSMIFDDPDTAGLEEDARLTAIWLWTLSTAEDADRANGGASEPAGTAGFALEFDAARKIAQGLGVHLQDLDGRILTIQGNTARLLPVAQRAETLIGPGVHTSGFRERPAGLFDHTPATPTRPGATGRPPAPGETTLDRVHQAMILFSLGQTRTLDQFLERHADTRFRKLAQALSALYPARTAEKRWIDGVLARVRRILD
ncbi:MAG: DUF1156 domain-containing protein, partial [Planctomycetota bacterium]